MKRSELKKYLQNNNAIAEEGDLHIEIYPFGREGDLEDQAPEEHHQKEE